MYVDKNGHYIIRKYFMWEGVGWAFQNIGRQKYKHIESAQRAISKWIKKYESSTTKDIQLHSQV